MMNMKPEPSNLEIWSGMWDQDPLHALAMLIVDPAHLDNNPSIRQYLVHFYRTQKGQSYFNDHENWEIFEGEWFNTYAYNRLEGLTEPDVATRLERLFLPLIQDLSEYGTTRPLLRPLVQTILTICPTFAFSPFTPLHHLEAEEYLQVLVRHYYGRCRNPILKFLLEKSFPKSQRHIFDLKYYLRRGQLTDYLNEILARNYSESWRKFCVQDSSSPEFFDEFDKLLELEFSAEKAKIIRYPGPQKTGSRTKPTHLASDFSELKVAADKGSPSEKITGLKPYNRFEYDGFSLHSALGKRQGQSVIQIIVKPSSGVDSALIACEPEPYRMEYPDYLELTNKGYYLISVSVRRSDESELIEDCLFYVPSSNS